MAKIRNILSGLAMLSGLSAVAVQPATTAWTLEVGSSHLATTYLSPLKYSGYALGVHYERFQPMGFAPERWRQQILAGVDFADAENPAGNGSMLQANLSGSWGMLHAWQLPCRLEVMAGGATGVNLGGLYNRRNGNNPATAVADWHLSATAILAWHTHLRGRRLALRWQTSFPLTAVFFSPDYDELYYEIWLGNHSGLVHWGWPGNFRRWNNSLVADLQLGRHALRLGLSQRLLSERACGITTRILSWSLAVGWTL